MFSKQIMRVLSEVFILRIRVRNPNAEWCRLIFKSSQLRLIGKMEVTRTVLALSLTRVRVRYHPSLWILYASPRGILFDEQRYTNSTTWSRQKHHTTVRLGIARKYTYGSKVLLNIFQTGHIPYMPGHCGKRQSGLYPSSCFLHAAATRVTW